MAEKAAKKVKKEAGKQLRVTLVKSLIGASDKQKGTVEALGLKKIRQNKVHSDSAALQGMLFVVKHLICVEEVK